MKQIESIIDNLLQHKISKKEAVEKIKTECINTQSQPTYGVITLVGAHDIFPSTRNDTIYKIMPPTR